MRTRDWTGFFSWVMVGRRCTCLNRRLNSFQRNNSTQAESSWTRRLLETRCTTGFNKIHNLCRDHYEINAHPLDCARSGDFAHDLLSRHKKERFHHNISDIVSQYLADSFHDRFTHESCSECSRRYSRSHNRNSTSPHLSGQVLILAQETLFTTSPRSPQSYTSARSLFRRSTLHHNRTPANRISCHHHQPYQHPASIPKDHGCVIQWCRARLHVVTLCASYWCHLNRPTMDPLDRVARRTITSFFQSRHHRLCHCFPNIRHRRAKWRSKWKWDYSHQIDHSLVQLKCPFSLQRTCFILPRSCRRFSRSSLDCPMSPFGMRPTTMSIRSTTYRLVSLTLSGKDNRV